MLTSPSWFPALFSVARDAAILSSSGVLKSKAAKLSAMEVRDHVACARSDRRPRSLGELMDLTLSASQTVVASLYRILWHGYVGQLAALPRVQIPVFVSSTRGKGGGAFGAPQVCDLTSVQLMVCGILFAAASLDSLTGDTDNGGLLRVAIATAEAQVHARNDTMKSAQRL
jgi:hypothetical protein